jgi:hypothetical protein
MSCFFRGASKKWPEAHPNPPLSNSGLASENRDRNNEIIARNGCPYKGTTALDP